MHITEKPSVRGRSRPGTRRWGAVAAGVAVAALVAAGCSSSPSSGSSGGKTTITELDYYTAQWRQYGRELV